MNQNLLLSAVVAIGWAGGCMTSADTVEQTSSDAQDLYVKGTRIWHTLTIPVCWDNPSSGNTSERGWVQSKVAATWAAVSDARFTGWGTCAATQTGIHIRINDEGPHTIALGRDLDGAAGGMVLNFTFNNWTRQLRNSDGVSGTASGCARIEKHAIGGFSTV